VQEIYSQEFSGFFIPPNPLERLGYYINVLLQHPVSKCKLCGPALDIKRMKLNEIGVQLWR
jgi:hypothetical protein